MDAQTTDAVVQSLATIGGAGFTLYVLVKVVTASLVRVIQVQNERSDKDGVRLDKEMQRADRAEERHDECIRLVEELRQELLSVKAKVAANELQMASDVMRIRHLEGIIERRRDMKE